MNAHPLYYRCPHTKERLELVAGGLRSASGRTYPVRDGVPSFLDGDALDASDSRAKAEYDKSAEEAYDRGLEWLFASFREDESRVRESMLDRLELSPSASVLEVSCGTGHDTKRIRARLSSEGRLFAMDLSAAMVEVCRRNVGRSGGAPVEFFVGNASYLPFADRTFDAAYHFGGINTFSEKQRAIAEMTRVVKVGGKVVFGDEGVPPHLRDTTFGKILVNSNPLYRHEPPMALLPECAREVTLRWVLGNAFYLIDYRVGEGPPPLDLDLAIPGRRGGTHRTRFYGQLEGVTPETKAAVEAAAKNAGLNVHEWLEKTLAPLVKR